MLTRFLMKGRPQKRARESRISEEDRQYYLEVDLQVRADKQREFIEGSIGLLDTFREAGLTLVASAWRTSTDPIQLLNIWDLTNDADTLLEAELALPDVPRFNTFNALIAHEVKTIVIPIARSERIEPNERLSPEAHRYLKITTKVPFHSLAEFGARIEADMAPFTRKAHWLLGDTFYAVTGVAGTISQLWAIPAEDSSPAQVIGHLQEASWLKVDDITRPNIEILRLTPADPNVRASQKVGVQNG